MRAIVVALIVAMVLVQRPSMAAEPEQAATQLLAKVQAFYEKTQDLRADVDQKYTFHAMKRTLKASGAMSLKKPGMLRWDVTKPYAKQFVVDGQALHVYDSEDQEVVVKKDFAADSLSAAVTFLWGRGQLARDFDVSIVPRADIGPNVLQLTPKRKGDGLSKLYFDVDPATGLVRTSVVVDPEGNENRLSFSNVRTNTGLSAEHFRFSVPKGATVTNR